MLNVLDQPKARAWFSCCFKRDDFSMEEAESAVCTLNSWILCFRGAGNFELKGFLPRVLFNRENDAVSAEELLVELGGIAPEVEVQSSFSLRRAMELYSLVLIMIPVGTLEVTWRYWGLNKESLKLWAMLIIPWMVMIGVILVIGTWIEGGYRELRNKE